MINIKDNYLDTSALNEKYHENSIEMVLIKEMINSQEEYRYSSLDELEFELQLRREIVNTAFLLNKSGMDFETFDKSRCNSKFWNRTNNGGFDLRDDVRPSDAINDIFTKGNKYATECATAIVIIYYKALLNVFKEEQFNKIFDKIYLMDWDIRERLLKEVAISKPVSENLLGDRKYFSNPDYNLDTPEWQGENVIILDNLRYYGHGIGVGSSERIIQELNSNRRKDATKSAYLKDVAARPNFKKLANVYYNKRNIESKIVWKDFPMSIFKI